MLRCPLICVAEFTSEVVKVEKCDHFPTLNDYKAKSQHKQCFRKYRNILFTVEHFYSHDPAMQTTLIFFLSMSTLREYRTKIDRFSYFLLLFQPGIRYFKKMEKLISWVSKVLELLREPEVVGIFYLEGQKTILATSDFQPLFWLLKLCSIPLTLGLIGRDEDGGLSTILLYSCEFAC